MPYGMEDVMRGYAVKLINGCKIDIGTKGKLNRLEWILKVIFIMSNAQILKFISNQQTVALPQGHSTPFEPMTHI
jgi:hypothetical protein